MADDLPAFEIGLVEGDTRENNVTQDMALMTIAAPEGKARCVMNADLSRMRAHAKVMEPEGSLPFFHTTRDTAGISRTGNYLK